MTLLCLPEGPRVRFIDGAMHVDDLNPVVSTRWRMSRWEMLAFAARTLWAALRYSRAGDLSSLQSVDVAAMIA